MSQRRYNPLTGDWLLLSEGRLQRPWQGAEEAVASHAPVHDPNCYLCPGNPRANGTVNPRYEHCWAFANDFPALSEDADPTPAHAHSLIRELPTTGVCRVLCYSPRHDAHFASLPHNAVARVVDAWQLEYRVLSERFAWVQIFENRGAMMGASNPHPHGQIWATKHLPQAPAREHHQQQQYFDEHQRALLSDYLQEELRRGERVVIQGAMWTAVVPYWATWPYETLLLPNVHISHFGQLTAGAKADLATTLRALTRCYDKLFDVPFPYSMGWHGHSARHWTLHAHFYPPLLRGATVRKHMVGYELLAEVQRDISPEQAAEHLRRALNR